MRNLQLVKDPREHFAIFWKEKNSDGPARAVELREALGELVERIRGGDFLARCATVELLPPTGDKTLEDELGNFISSESPAVSSGAPRKVPGTYWVVPGDLLEVALLACELVEQERENKRDVHEQYARHRSEDAP